LYERFHRRSSADSWQPSATFASALRELVGAFALERYLHRVTAPWFPQSISKEKIDALLDKPCAKGLTTLGFDDHLDIWGRKTLGSLRSNKTQCSSVISMPPGRLVHSSRVYGTFGKMRSSKAISRRLSVRLFASARRAFDKAENHDKAKQCEIAIALAQEIADLSNSGDM
jgi:hypothetical protein